MTRPITDAIKQESATASYRRIHRNRERGQITILLAVSMVVLLLFMGLAMDVGLAYTTKAKLSKAVDAACLAAMKNLAQGNAKAGALALDAFNANYPVTGLDAVPPAVTVGFTTDSYGQTLINVNATATARTFFMRLLPQFRTITVSDGAQATRGKLVMTLTLDRSGSMSSNGGSGALPPAVTSFVGYFDNANDEVAMVSFASNAKVDRAIGYNFVTPISNAVKAMSFGGGTFGLGGITLAKTTNDSVVVQPGQNVVKVVVYFTDGYVNTIQDTFNCGPGRPTLYNYGGYDSGTSVDFFDPATGTDWGGLTKQGYPPHSPQPDCTGVARFTSAIDGSSKSFTRSNVTADAKYRSLQIANAMRSEGMVVYAIGLGNSVDQTFLKQIANDPTSASYNPAQPDGLAVFAPNCPSTQCSAELLQVFQTIASKILLRLTQ